MQKEKGQKGSSESGQNGKWNFWYFNFWYFNNLIIVEILIGFTTDRNFLVGYEEREALMDVL